MRNRGKEANDILLFGNSEVQLRISGALSDMYYLLSRDYGVKSSLQLVGNRYLLRVRQQKALMGMSCSNQQKTKRLLKELKTTELPERLYFDGFNILIILESYLSGAYLFKGIDGCYRDLSGIHGTYKKVVQTEKALYLIMEFCVQNKIDCIHWILDKPVSNSGRLKQFILEFAAINKLNWQVELVNNPDNFLIESKQAVVSSDAYILDNCTNWFNLVKELISNKDNVLEFEYAE